MKRIKLNRSCSRALDRGVAPVAAQAAVIATALLLVAGVAFLVAGQGWRMPALLVIGVLLGMALYHAAFGFTAAYRRLIVQRDTSGVEAQLLMLAVATMLFAPVLAAGSVLGQPVIGAAAPVGVQVVAGAFLFGLGMQLAGGCGSGTLYTLGGGSARMVVTLIFFCLGSFWASLDMGVWDALPSVGVISLGETFGWAGAAAMQVGVFGVLALLLRRWRNPWPARHEPAAYHWLRGPWPIIGGAIGLAILNVATLVVAGHPWTITWAFALWGAKVAMGLGWDPTSSLFWSSDFQREALAAGILEDVTSLMDIGLVLGALGAAGLAGRFAPSARIPLGTLAAAILGGLAMGYGARIAFGCNVGAFFSGVASTSVHGWLWIMCAFPGTWVGVQMRPWFGLAN